MKVIQVLPALNSGGVERGTLEIAKALVAKGHESIVISAGGSMVKELERDGSRHIYLDCGKKSLLTFFRAWKATKILKKENADILHLRSRLPAWVFYFAWNKLPKSIRPKLFTTYHGLYSVNRYSAVMLKSQHVIAVSHWVKQHILKHYPHTDALKLHVIPRGITHSDFTHGFQPSRTWLKQWHNEFPELINKKIILLPGRVSRLKGQLAFIELIAALISQDSSVVGVIAGGIDSGKQNYLNEIHQKVHNKDLTNHIVFTGQRNDLKEIMSISTATLNLSTKPEAFGRTILESLALGTPTFAWDRGGSLEILEKIWPYGLIPFGDFQVLTQKLQALLVNKEATNIPEVTDYTLSDMCKSTIDLYDKACNRPSS